MSEKKELNKEQLEKVNGGYYGSVEDIDWIFTKDAQAYVELTDSTKVEGKVTKRGVIGIARSGTDYYYIESTLNTNINGWYPGPKFSNKTVGISNKYNGLGEPAVIAW